MKLPTHSHLGDESLATIPASSGEFVIRSADAPPSSSRCTRILLISIPLAWFVLWSAGLPFPNGDDAFFAGAAIHLADTGQLANPWIVGWMQWIPNVHLDRFYVHPPFASYVLAGWLRVWGVSESSMTAYSCALGALASTAAAMCLVRRGARLLPAALGASIITLYLLHRGLRPEGVGLALLFLGQLLLSFFDRRGWWFCGSLLVLASPFCHAFLSIFALPAIVYHLWLFKKSTNKRDEFVLRTRLSAAAGIVVLILFFAAIRGELGAFLNDFFGHTMIVTPSASRFSRFIEQLVIGRTAFPNFAIFLILTSLISWRFFTAPGSRSTLLITLGVYVIVVGCGIGLYAPFTATFAVMFAWLFALAWSIRLEGFSHAAALLPSGILVGQGLIAHGAEYAINRSIPAPDVAGIERYVTEARPEMVLFDAFALRYVFDFKPPAGSMDIAWSWSAGLSERFWSIEAIGHRDLWVRQRRSDLTDSASELHREPPTLFGRPFRSIQPARDIAVIAGAALLPPAANFPFSQRGRLPADQP